MLCFSYRLFLKVWIIEMFIVENNWKYFLVVYILLWKFIGELVSLDWLDVLWVSLEMIFLYIKNYDLVFF